MIVAATTIVAAAEEKGAIITTIAVVEEAEMAEEDVVEAAVAEVEEERTEDLLPKIGSKWPRNNPRLDRPVSCGYTKNAFSSLISLAPNLFVAANAGAPVDGSAWMATRRAKQQEEEAEMKKKRQEAKEREKEEKNQRRKSQLQALKVCSQLDSYILARFRFS